MAKGRKQTPPPSPRAARLNARKPPVAGAAAPALCEAASAAPVAPLLIMPILPEMLPMFQSIERGESSGDEASSAPAAVLRGGPPDPPRPGPGGGGGDVDEDDDEDSDDASGFDFEGKEGKMQMVSKAEQKEKRENCPSFRKSEEKRKNQIRLASILNRQYQEDLRAEPRRKRHARTSTQPAVVSITHKN
jgi:hypothetical protein